MKKFLKYIFVAFIGIVVTTMIACIIGIVALVGIITSDDEGVSEVKDNSVLVVKLSGDIVEHAEKGSPLSALTEKTEIQGLDDIVSAIDNAAECKEISGIYIEAGFLQSDYSALQEIRHALLKAKKNKKWIISYADAYSQGAYYVCSAADEIWINPQGVVDIHGLSGQTTYLKDLLEKVGVKMKVIKVGTYKSATETYTEDHMSDANREQSTRYILGMWNIIAQDIAEGRGLTFKDVNSLADTLTTLQDTKFLMDKNLITRTLYSEDVKKEIKKILKLGDNDDISQISCKDLAKLTKKSGSENKIAIYYAQGSIVQNAESGLVMGDAGIVSKKMVSDLEKLAKDDNIKAVVIRINSGGGDAFASEEIWHSVMTLKDKKPVVVSMGSMTASGAYYLSSGASWIVAQPTTLTGSIGIFGLLPDVTELMQSKLGIKFDKVITNKHADYASALTARPLSAEEEAMLQQSVNRGYELFCKRVSDGRKIPVDQVKTVAEGRVWIAADAKSHKLVDEIGGLKNAIDKAAKLAKLDKYETSCYPAKKAWYEDLFDNIEERNNNLDEQLQSTLGVYYEPFKMVKDIKNQNPIQARIPILISVE
ncbi:MAG: signal peptide peptidase SppA [Prevotella sp.]|nr:signal peptide peptidase SppA [Prevotella sp.]